MKSSLWDLWDTIKINSTCIMRIPERKEKEKGTESIFKAIIAKNSQTSGGKWTSRSKWPKGPQIGWNQTGLHWHTLQLNCQKSTKRQRILKAARKMKEITYKGIPPKTIYRFLNRNFSGQETMEWYIQNIERKKEATQKPVNQEFYTQQSCPFRSEREIKTCLNKQKQRELITTRPILQ